MAQQSLRKEEALGLFVAIAAHAGLVAFLLLKPPAPPLPPPERMTVTLSEDVGLTSTAPSLSPEPASDSGPELGEPAPEPSVAPPPQVQPKAAVAPPPPRPQPAPPKPVAKPQPSPVKPAPVKPAPPQPKQPAKAQSVPLPPGFAPRPAAAQPASKPAAKPGASKFADAFNKGIPGAAGKAQSQAPAAAAFGPQQQSALRAAIMRQLKPKWVAPQGFEAEKLVTQVRFSLDRQGRVVGEPVVVSQSGQTPANAAQVKRHAEQAIRAVKLAQPFILPPDFYPYWQTVTSTFDRRLSQ